MKVGIFPHPQSQPYVLKQAVLCVISNTIILVACYQRRSALLLKARGGNGSVSEDGEDGEDSKGQRVAAVDGAPKRSRQRCFLSCCNGLLRVVHVGLLILLCAGSIVAAQVITGYQAPGKVLSVTLADGRKTTVHVYCHGPDNATLPVIWVVGSAAHGVVDYYGVQFFLAEGGRRVCTMDCLGFGWSGDYLKGGANTFAYMNSTIAASGERLPLILVGSGGGASPVVEYASTYPQNVAGVVFMTAFSPGIEFDDYARVHGLTDDQKNSYRDNELSGRIQSTGLITGVAIPCGLMPVFVSLASVPKDYYPVERRMEFRAQLWTSRMWLNQVFGLQYIRSHPDNQDPLVTMPLASNIPLVHVTCNLNATQVCLPKYQGQVISADKCAEMVASNDFFFGKQVNMTLALKPTARFLFNTEDDCTLGFIVDKPQASANFILDAVHGITL